MPDVVAFRSKFLILTSGIFALDLTDDETAAICASQIAHIITNHDEAERSTKLLILLTIPPNLAFFLSAMYFRNLLFCAYITTTFAIEGLSWAILGEVRSEKATKIGMLLMSEAGFNPAAAVSVEYKMADVVKQSKETGRTGPGTRGGLVSTPEAMHSEFLLTGLAGRVRREH